MTGCAGPGGMSVGRGSIRGMTSTGRGRGLDMFRDGDFPLYTLTFARNLSRAELLIRMGVDTETLGFRPATDLTDDLGDDLFDEDEPVVVAGADGPWAWAWEQGGVHGLDARTLSAVSAGTEAVVLHHNEKPMDWFKYAVGGGVVVGFHTLQAIEPTGQDPTRLDELMRPLGLVRGRVAPVHGVLALLETAFGIGLTAPGDEARWSGRLRRLPE